MHRVHNISRLLLDVKRRMLNVEMSIPELTVSFLSPMNGCIEFANPFTVSKLLIKLCARLFMKGVAESDPNLQVFELKKKQPVRKV